MGSASHRDAQPTFYVRKAVWLIFCGAIALTLALPIATAVHQRWLTLQAHAMVWPAQPQAGAPAHLIVSLSDATDQAAVGGPWANVMASWNMPEMEMGNYQTKIAGSQDGQGTFIIPLQLNMAGRWSVQVTLQTPGRPNWYSRLDIIVLPSSVGSPVAIVCCSKLWGSDLL